MRIPDGMTEQEVMVIIDKVAAGLAPKFKFGYHDIDDIKQEARLIAWKGLDKYDSTRPLENFLWIHVRNRLINYKRDNYERLDKPCLDCPFYDQHCLKSTSQCSEFNDKHNCELYVTWFNRNSAKKNLMNPIELGAIDDSTESHLHLTEIEPNEEMAGDELIKLIDKDLSLDLRPYYLRMRAGEKVQKKHQTLVRAAIVDILEKNGYAK